MGWSYFNDEINGLLSRYAPKFDGSSAYIQLDDKTTLTSDWYVSLTVEMSVISQNMSLIGNNSEQTTSIQLLTNGGLSVRTSSGKTIDTSSGAVVAGNKHIIKVNVVNDVGTVYVDNIPIASGDLSGDFPINYIGRYRAGGFNFVEGIMYDVDLNGDLWAIDEEWSEYPTITSSLGNTATAKNFTSDDIVEINL